MANVNSLTSNSYGNSYNLYGNRNVLTGLASGMDTEAMIQNSIAGYLMKVSSLQQKQTMITWKQDAFRNIIDQMNSIVQKYTSYTSKTNLASNNFFTSASKTETLGAYASAISATGSTKSDIQINSVTQLATSARYSVDARALDVKAADKAIGGDIDWGARRTVGQVNGTISLKYGNQTIDLTFDENDNEMINKGGLKDVLQKKLSEIDIKAKDGSMVKADSLIRVTVDAGTTFKFEAKTNNADYDGSSVYINVVSGNVGKLLGASRAGSDMSDKVKNNSFTVPDIGALVKEESMAEYLSGKSVSVTLDGVTKTVKIGDLAEYEKSLSSSADEEIAKVKADIEALGDSEEDDILRAQYQEELKRLQSVRANEIGGQLTEKLKEDLQGSIDKAFGEGRVTVGLNDDGTGLRFDPAKGSGSTLLVTSSAGEALGIGKSGVSNYFNVSSTLKDLLGDDLKNYRIAANGDIRSEGSGDGVKYYDADGNRVVQELDEEGNGTGNWYRADDDGKYLYNLEINGKQVGRFTEDSALENVITAINSDPDVGVKVSYSNLTGEFVFTANETGAGGKIEFGEGLAQKLFTTGDESKYERTEGKDAVVNATVNGKKLTITRSSNVINMDGLNVTLNKTFNVDEDGKAVDGEAVRFKTSSDSDKIVDTIKTFVEDLNKLMQDIHDAYATMPLTKAGSSSSSRYEPLTEEDRANMNENAIAAYEEKAKTGILFGDTDLTQLYSNLLNAIQRSGSDRMDMEAIGLTTTYSGGVTTLSLDEDKLRAALESDPDKVRNVFAKTVDGGAKSNGLMATLKTTMNNYASTSLASPGILVSKAGTKLSALSLMNNNLQKEYDNLEKQIEQWQSRMSDKVDYYTRQFTQLEKLMSIMNNQSSMLAGLMGY